MIVGEGLASHAKYDVETMGGYGIRSYLRCHP